jgi:hypothetical protein
MLPEILTEQLHAELASIWGPLTIAEQAHPDVEGGLLVGQDPPGIPNGLPASRSSKLAAASPVITTVSRLPRTC